MNKLLRVGILGQGNIGKCHAAELAAIPDVDVTAICSLKVQSAREICQTIFKKKAAIYENFVEMINNEKLDALFICIPPFAHNGQFEVAAEKGIHIFIEKPIAIDSARALSMVNSAKKSGIITQVGYNMRYGAAVRELKRMIDDGTSGAPTLFNGKYECNSLHSTWWRDVAASGGQVFEQVIHIYDMAMHFLGKPVKVSGMLANICHKDILDYTVEDTSVSIIQF